MPEQLFSLQIKFRIGEMFVTLVVNVKQNKIYQQTSLLIKQTISIYTQDIHLLMAYLYKMEFILISLFSLAFDWRSMQTTN